MDTHLEIGVWALGGRDLPGLSIYEAQGVNPENI